MRTYGVAFLLILLSTACSRPAPESGNVFFTCTRFQADSLSQTPFLFEDAGGAISLIYQSGLNGGEVRIRRPYYRADSVLPALDNHLLNWADFPNAAVFDGRLFGYRLQRRGGKGFNYDIEQFGDRTGRPYPENVDAEHGFGSYAAASDGLHLTWIDGRHYAGHGHETGHGEGGQSELRSVLVSDSGAVAEPALLDERICDCCRTVSVSADGRALVFYRDRSGDEVRDIYYVVRENNAWSKPVALEKDGWIIHGCPVNGPDADAEGRELYVAWFTGAMGSNRVKLKYSRDAGRSFSESKELASGAVIGRVAVTAASNGTAFVGWLEQFNEDRALFKTVQVRGLDVLKTWHVDTLEAARRSGFPDLAIAGDTLIAVYRSADRLKMKKLVL